MCNTTSRFGVDLNPGDDQHLDDLLDEALAESFPASDPIAVGIESKVQSPGVTGKTTMNTPKQEVRRGAERGYADHGWLKSFHTFSFADYFDPLHVEFGPLRVINEDRVAAGEGFGTHGHRDMEIISYVLEGELAHKDSMGHESTIRPGDVQRMSAGTGVRHSEYNGSAKQSVHFLQVWILPNQENLEPSYEEKNFADAEKRGRLRLIASPDRADGSLLIHQDARVYAGLFDEGESAALAVAAPRRAYVHVARGELKVNGTALRAGDGLKLLDTRTLTVTGGQGGELLVFDLP